MVTLGEAMYRTLRDGISLKTAVVPTAEGSEMSEVFGTVEIHLLLFCWPFSCTY